MDKETQQLFWIWSAMMQRCYNPRDKGYNNYGGRGIIVCEKWKNSWRDFITDMGTREKGMLLDRKNNDGNYDPENCKWSTRKEQNSNRRICIYVMDNNDKITLKEYCRRYNIRYRAISKRIKKGWKLDKALKIPVGLRNQFDERKNNA